MSNSTTLKIGSTFNYGGTPQTVISIIDGEIRFKTADNRKNTLLVSQFEDNYYGFITDVKY